jgi:hypothetical protein
MPLVLEQRDKFRSELRGALVEEARQKGTRLAGSKLEEEVDKAEYRNLRIAYMVKFKDPNGLKDKFTVGPDEGIEGYRRKIAEFRKLMPTASEA